MPAPSHPDRQAAAGIVAVVAAGMVGAFHVGKLPPALPLLRAEFGLSLVAAGWLVALMQLAGATLALAGGSIADRLGHRRTMIVGLAVLVAGGLLGAAAPGAALLLAARAIESAGLLLTVLPGPALLARLARPARLRLVMGWWAAYMPSGMAAMLLGGAALIERVGWRWVWVACALMAAGAAVAVARWVRPPAAALPTASSIGLARQVLASGGAWLLTGCFGLYAAQWIGVFSFLPTLYRDEGLGLGVAGALSAAGVAVNAVGNVGAGWLLSRGAPRAGLIAAAAGVMMLGAWVAFGAQAPLAVRFAAILGFSAAGGLIPGTLFASVAAFAPHPGAVSTTAGLMQQGSSLGQIVSPLVLAAVASASGGWQHAWIVTGAFACGVLAIAAAIAARDRPAV